MPLLLRYTAGLAQSGRNFNNVQGGVGETRGTCMLKLKLGKIQVMTRLTVIDMAPGLDILLSDAWLHDQKAILDYGSGTCTLLHKGKMCVLKAVAPQHSHSPRKPLLSFVQMKRMAKQNAEYCLVMVTAKKDEQVFPSPPAVNPNLMTPSRLESVVLDVFTEKAPFGGSKVQCEIEVIPTTTDKPINRPMFRYSPLEMAEIERQVTQLLEQGYISPSTSPYGAPMLFVKKPRSTELKMCVDWRALNAITTKNAGPLPRIEDLMAVLSGAKVFSSFDLRQAYHQVNLLPSDRPKTAFKTRSCYSIGRCP